MHAWNSEAVEASYKQSTYGFLTNFGKTELHPSCVAMAFRALVAEGYDRNDVTTLQKARDPSRHAGNPRIPFETLNWGSFTMMLSELGKEAELNDLLEYLDERMSPTWENGGLFYPRNDVLVDDEWHLTHMEPHSGNSSIGYARLNVKDGQKKMWDQPWTRELLNSRPWVDGVSFADGIDFLRAVWDEENEAMIVTMRQLDGVARRQVLSCRNLGEGTWAVFVNGEFHKQADITDGGIVAVDCDVGGVEVDVVIERALA